MAAPRKNGGADNELPDEDVTTNDAVFTTRTAGGERVQVIEAEASTDKVAPSPGSDRTPGEPTDSPGGSSDLVTLTVTPEQAESMKLLLSQLSFTGGPGGIAAFVAQQRQAIENDQSAKDSNQAAYEGHQAKLKEMNVTLQSAVTPEIAALEMRARDKLYAKTLAMDKSSVPGGLYLASDGETLINANGDRVNKDGSKVN